MSSLLDEVVDITITRQTQAANVASFNGILLAQEILMADITPVFSERVRRYTSLTEMATAGFTTADPVYLMAQAIFRQNPNPGEVYIGRKLKGVDGTETWVEAMPLIAADSSAWYGFCIGDKTLADLQAVAAWAELNKKLFMISDDDANIIDSTGDIAEYVNTQDYDRTVVIYSDVADFATTDTCMGAAWMGLQFPKAPGSSNWAYKTLKGVVAYEITSAQRTTAFGKQCNLFEAIAGVSVTRYGTVGSGEYIDIIRGIDWLEAKIQEKVFNSFLNNEKIPFIDAGIQSIVSQISAALQEAADVGLIIGAEDEENGYTVSASLASAVSATNKLARNLPGITFRATLQGAINKTTINGFVGL